MPNFQVRPEKPTVFIADYKGSGNGRWTGLAVLITGVGYPIKGSPPETLESPFIKPIMGWSVYPVGVKDSPYYRYTVRTLSDKTYIAQTYGNTWSMSDYNLAPESHYSGWKQLEYGLYKLKLYIEGRKPLVLDL